MRRSKLIRLTLLPMLAAAACASGQENARTFSGGEQMLYQSDPADCAEGDGDSRCAREDESGTSYGGFGGYFHLGGS